jgi:hypothetical protein
LIWQGEHLDDILVLRHIWHRKEQEPGSETDLLSFFRSKETEQFIHHDPIRTAIKKGK